MNNLVKMVVTLSVISALAAGALAMADKMTRKKIAMQAKLKAARAVRKIFPDCMKPAERTVKSPKGENITVYECPGQRTCFIFTSNSASGISRPYSGLIKVMVGVGGKGAIEGLEIITQSETPGLGANIEERSWRDQFKGLSLTHGKLAVKKVDPTGSIDAISGATISSKAVTGTIKAALQFYSTSLKGKKNLRKPGMKRRPRNTRGPRQLRKGPWTKAGRRSSMAAVPLDIINRGTTPGLKGKRAILKDLNWRKARAKQRGADPEKLRKKKAAMGGAK